MEYIVKSTDTMDYIALHDCEINHAEWDNADLVMYFDWVDVLKSHPCNDTGKAMIAENAALRFENAKVIKSVVYDMQRVFEEMKRTGESHVPTNEADIVPVDIIELCEGFTVLQDTLNFKEGRYTWNCIGDNEFTIECDHIHTCWNDFKEAAWFEGWNDNKGVNVKRMITHDADKPNGQIEYTLPLLTDIFNKINEMNGITKSWMQLYLSEEKVETLYITCADENIFTCIHSNGDVTLSLTEDKISENESFLSYGVFAVNRDIRVSRSAVKGAVHRFYKHNGISECAEWRQNNEKFWE